MATVKAYAAHLLDARGPNSDIARRPARVADDTADVAARSSDAPDPAYWTPYDYHLIESEGRAMRRAQIYSMIATCGAYLWQRISNVLRR